MRTWLILTISILFSQTVFGNPPPPPPLGPPLEEVVAKAKEAVARGLTDQDLTMKVGLHTAWHIVHGVLAYGKELELEDPESKSKLSALKWLQDGGSWRKQPSFITSGPRFRGNSDGPQFQGHLSQFAGYVSEIGLPLDTIFRARNLKKNAWENRSLDKLYDEVKLSVSAKKAQNDDNQSSWALWALARSGYVKVDETWENADGEEINFEKLVHVELYRDLEESPCAGLHGMYAMSLALKLFKATNRPLSGDWLLADFQERKLLERARKHQNEEDGSFSADYLNGRAQGDNWRESLPGNGHVLEWLMVALPDSELKSEWVLRGVHSVAENVLQAQVNDHDIEGYLQIMGTGLSKEKMDPIFERYLTLGGYFHAVHALKLYLGRIGSVD